MRKLLVTLSALFVLTACDMAETGTVYEKEFIPAHTEQTEEVCINSVKKSSIAIILAIGFLNEICK